MDAKTFVVLAILLYAVEALSLSSEGTNVCSRLVVYTRLQTKVFFRTTTEEYQSCCKRIIFCYKKCMKRRRVRRTFMKMIVVPKLKTIYFCCKGWKQGRNSSLARGCDFPVCQEGCRIGKCVRPDTCSYEYDSRKGVDKSLVKDDKCGGVINNTNGVIKIFGNELPTETKLCHYQINLPQIQPIRFNYERFHINETVTCGRSGVTMLEGNKTKFFFCALHKPTNENLILTSQTINIEVIVSNWKTGDGIVLKFVPEINGD